MKREKLTAAIRAALLAPVDEASRAMDRLIATCGCDACARTRKALARRSAVTR